MRAHAHMRACMHAHTGGWRSSPLSGARVIGNGTHAGMADWRQSDRDGPHEVMLVDMRADIKHVEYIDATVDRLA